MRRNGDGRTTHVTESETLGDTWLQALEHIQRSSEYLFNGYIEANHALVASLGGPTSYRRDGNVESDGTENETRPSWSFERSTDDYEDLGVGDTVSFTKTISSDDVDAFAVSSGDTNRLHLDDQFAERTRFGGPIVHGTLVVGLISAALARLPGVTIYLSQEVEFRSPARPGETLTATCEITEDIGGNKYRLDTTVRNEAGEKFVDGESVVLIDEPPEGGESR